jgi:hypothetical protein
VTYRQPHLSGKFLGGQLYHDTKYVKFKLPFRRFSVRFFEIWDSKCGHAGSGLIFAENVD